MKKLISSRRGAAIELAIGVMFVMIALSIILVTNASLQNKEMKSDVADLEQKIELMEIGEYVCEHQADFTEGQLTPIENTVYTVLRSENTYEIYKGENVVLTIEVDGNKIISWN